MLEGLAALSLLIIDDNKQMRTIVGTVLGAAGVRSLHYAPDGAEGLKVIARRQIDVAYVDHEMPGMNGLDFISAVRAMETPDRFMPIIMLTGYSDMPRLSAARDRGVTDFLRKPVTAKDILARLEAAILHPRPFATGKTYFGPDRRRKLRGTYLGPFRRTSDQHASLEL